MKLIDVAKVGDYVDYGGIISKRKKYVNSKGEIFFRQNINWRVLRNDGKSLTLISERPIQNRVCLYSAKGYLEGPNMLDQMADELYSSRIGKARNLKIEDVNELLGYKVDKVDTEEGRGKVPYGTKISELRREHGFELLHRKTPDGKNIDEYEQTYYSYYGRNYKSKNSKVYQLLFGKESEFLFQNDDQYQYWLSSSCVSADYCHNMLIFRIYCIYDGKVGAPGLYFSNGGNLGNIINSSRPIVILRPTVLVTNEQANGKTPAKAWEIK